jgi:hypothetical protein
MFPLYVCQYGSIVIALWLELHFFFAGYPLDCALDTTMAFPFPGGSTGVHD